nr:Down syndrome cell adhesion molecule-like protein Dscam2 isoform X2 [Parasteatoda tepidariorum]
MNETFRMKIIFCFFSFLHIGCIIAGEPPIIQPFSFPENLSEGDQARLGCIINKGDSPLKFRWFLNNKEIQNGSQFHISTQASISVLEVKQLSGFSRGNFTCQVNNAAGRDTYTTLLAVNGSLSVDSPLTVRNGSLHFNPLLNEHRGDYVCEARNSVGLKLRKIITLSVLGEF